LTYFLKNIIKLFEVYMRDKTSFPVVADIDPAAPFPSRKAPMRKLTTFIYAIAITAAIFTIPMGIDAATRNHGPSEVTPASSGTSLMAKKARGQKARKWAKKARKSKYKKGPNSKKAASRRAHKAKGHKIG
jgi:hypothetical protein